MFSRILLAYDGSEEGLRAAAAAAEMAKHFDSWVRVIHVREGAMVADAGFGVPTVVEGEPETEATQVVQQALSILRDAGVEATGAVEFAQAGHAAHAIVAAAEAAAADLIVMGSRGLSDLAGLFLGSVTHKVLHDAKIPVLVIR